MMDRQSHALRALALPALLAIMPLGCGGGESESAAPPAALPVSPAAPAAPPVAASGAALEYPAVLAKFTDSLSADARALIFNTKGVSLDGSRAKGTWSALARALEQAQPQIEALMRVAETSQCTFAEVAIDPDTRKLPPESIEFFRGVRNGGAVLSADAARTFVAGDTAGAARRAAAIASMLRHVAASGLPKSGDFASDLLRRLELVVPPMAAGVNGTTLADADRAALLAALGALDAQAPCGIRGGALNDAYSAKQAAELAALKKSLGG
jgi:hypothetical protein